MYADVSNVYIDIPDLEPRRFIYPDASLTLLLLKSLNIACPQGIMGLITLSLGHISINDITFLSN